MISDALRLGKSKSLITDLSVSDNFDDDALTYRSNVEDQGGTIGDDYFLLLNSFVRGLKLDGVWSKLSLIHLTFGVSTLTASRVRLKHPGGVPLLATYNSITTVNYSPIDGIIGVSNRYINTGFNPSVLGKSSAAFGIHAMLSVGQPSNSSNWILGVSDTGTSAISNTVLGRRSGGAIEHGAIAATAATLVDLGNLSPPLIGMKGVERLGTEQRFYHDGSQIGSTVNAGDTLFGDEPIFALCRNLSGSPDGFAIGARLRGYIFTDGLNSGQVALLSDRWNAFESGAIGIL